MAQAVEAQVQQLISALTQQGLLSEQFNELMMLADADNPDFVVEVVQLYFEDAQVKIDQIGAMLSTPEPNFKELDSLVHQFKGASASVGAQVITQLCIRLREQCQVLDTPGCAQTHQHIAAAYQQLKLHLDQFIALEAHKKQLLAAGLP